ncbi:hypothetical protein F511_42788 [Dorcoceras hygrometricum]|uniref:Uncharacterized protein n=1 Tax=Dorcoceras hygrometricum TaxID=472368 RepID=A0A2Z7CE81_9LAMI|nr:hypothetical protein F511_42788 [Dorcoceras hygrometricum]
MKMKMEMRKNLKVGCTRSVSIGQSWINTEADQIGRELHAIKEMSKLELITSYSIPKESWRKIAVVKEETSWEENQLGNMLRPQQCSRADKIKKEKNKSS